MPNLVITSAGLAALKNVDAGGFKLDANRFKVTDHVYADSDNLTGSSTLLGSVIYAGPIGSVEVVSDTSVEYECIIPVAYPKTGSASIGSIGIYLADGTLFAIGKVSPAIQKDSTVNFSI
jgi:hypothetical protein